MIDVIRVGAHRRVRFVGLPSSREVQRLPSNDAIASFIGPLAYPTTLDTGRAEAVLGAHPCGGDPLESLAAAPRTGSVIGG